MPSELWIQPGAEDRWLGKAGGGLLTSGGAIPARGSGPGSPCTACSWPAIRPGGKPVMASLTPRFPKAPVSIGQSWLYSWRGWLPRVQLVWRAQILYSKTAQKYDMTGGEERIGLDKDKTTNAYVTEQGEETLTLKACVTRKQRDFLVNNRNKYFGQPFSWMGYGISSTSNWKEGITTGSFLYAWKKKVNLIRS